MGNIISSTSIIPPTADHDWWSRYVRQTWRSRRSQQLDEFLGMGRRALRRGESRQVLTDVEQQMMQVTSLLGGDEEANALTAAIAKLNSGGVLQTEKRAIERLLAAKYEEALAAAAAEQGTDEENKVMGYASAVLQQVLAVMRQNGLKTALDKFEEPLAEWRMHMHKVRRTAFIAVRAIVRLQREVRRSNRAAPSVDWMVSVVAQDRLHRLHELAAQQRELEVQLQDLQIALSQLQALKSTGQGGPPGPGRGGAGPPSTANRVMRSRGNPVAQRRTSEPGNGHDHGPPRTSGGALTGDLPLLGRASITGNARASHSPVRHSGAQGPQSRASVSGSNTPLTPSSPSLFRKGSCETIVSRGGHQHLIINSSASNSSSSSPVMGRGGGPGNGRTLPAAVAGHAHPMPPANGTSPLHTSSTTPLPLLPSVGSGGSGAAHSPAPPAGAKPDRPVVRPPAIAATAPAANTLIVRQTFVAGPDGTLQLPHTALMPTGTQGLTSPDGTGRLVDTLPVSPLAGKGMRTSFNGGPLPNSPTPGSPGPQVPLGAPTAAMAAGNQIMRRMSTMVAMDRSQGSDTQQLLDRVVRGGAGSAASASSTAAPQMGGPGAVKETSPRRMPGASPARGRAGGPPGTAQGRSSLGNIGVQGGPPARPLASMIRPGVTIQLIQDGENMEQATARLQVQVERTKYYLSEVARQFREAVVACNCGWADRRGWASSKTADEVSLDDWVACENFNVFRADTVRLIKAGQVAFMFVCGQNDTVVGLNGHAYDVWTSDPWEVAAEIAPSKLPPPNKDRHVGMPLGVRMLQQLCNAVESAAGAAAVPLMPVILNITEQQHGHVLSDMLQQPVYKRLRSNLYLLVQRSQATLRWSGLDGGFVEEPMQPLYNAGGGYAMMMLGWPGYAMRLTEEGQLVRLEGSLAQHLAQRNVQWFVSRGVNDMALIRGDGALDMRNLAYMSYLWQQPGQFGKYSMAVQAAVSYKLQADLAHQHGSVLLCRKPKTKGMVMGKLDGAVRMDRYAGGTAAVLPVVEVAECELASSHMQEMLTEIAGTRNSISAVPVGRYIFHFPTLLTALSSVTLMRPKLVAVHEGAEPGYRPQCVGGLAAASAVAGEVLALALGRDTCQLRVLLPMSDFSAHHSVKVVALRTAEPPLMLRSAEDMEALMGVVQAQDKDLCATVQRLAARAPSLTRQHKPPQSIVVFVQDNSPSVTATNVAIGLARRERNDVIHLLTVVPTDSQRADGEELISRLLKQVKGHIDVVTHVLVQDERGLLEVVVGVLEEVRCDLMVIGSASITRGGVTSAGSATAAPRTGTSGAARPTLAQQQAALLAPVNDASASSDAELLVSSVAMSLMRTCGLPTIVVTANTKTYLKRAVGGGGGADGPHAGGAGRGAGAGGAHRLAAMVVVEKHSRPMAHHFLRLLMEPTLRQDTLTFVQALPNGLLQEKDLNPIQSLSLRTLLSSFEDIAGSNDFHRPVTVLSGGEWDRALYAAVREQGAQLLCVQLPPGGTRSMPLHLLHLIRSCPCPVLVYPERVHIPGMSALNDVLHEA